jgi:ProP effector
LAKTTPPAQAPNQAQRQAAAATQIIILLAQVFPRAFFTYGGKRKPLKLGIHKDILALKLGIAQRALSRALRAYCGNLGYLRASVTGAARIDLQGEPAGVVTADEAEHARQRLVAYLQEKVRKKEVKQQQAHRHTGTPIPKPAAKPTPAQRRASLDALKQAAKARRGAL